MTRQVRIDRKREERKKERKKKRVKGINSRHRFLLRTIFFPKRKISSRWKMEETRKIF